MVFDKTGTLTAGKMRVVKMAFSSAVSSSHAASLLICRVAALLALSESNSDHPIARALVQFAKQLLGVEDVQSLGRQSRVKTAAGRGIRCTLELHGSAVPTDALLAPSKRQSSSEEALLTADTSLASFLRALQIRWGAEFLLAPSNGAPDTATVIEALTGEPIDNCKFDIVVGNSFSGVVSAVSAVHLLVKSFYAYLVILRIDTHENNGVQLLLLSTLQ